MTIDGVECSKLTGTHSLTANPLIPGQSQDTISAYLSNAKNGDTFTVSSRAWLTLDGETTAASTTINTFTVNAAVDKYDLGYFRSQQRHGSREWVL